MRRPKTSPGQASAGRAAADPGVSERGYWTDRSPEHHHFDPGLAAELADALAGSTVADFGCGTAEYVRALRAAGLDCRGYDGNPHTPELSGGLAEVLDLSRPADLGRRFDWVVSLEVGEHVPREFEAEFVGNLDRHCRVGLVISWAVVGQGGRGHCNERDNDDVRALVTPLGYQVDSDLERRLRHASRLWWFRDTILAFRRVGGDPP